MKRRKSALRPFQQQHGWGVGEQLGGRIAPEDLVRQIVGPVGAVGDTVAIEIEGGEIAPVVASPLMGPLDPARADILDLGAIAQESVAVNVIAL